MLFTFTALSCSSFKAPKDPNILVVHMAADPTNLNLLISNDFASSMVNGYIYESLIARDNETLEWIPRLASAWEVSKDGMQYTFHLKEGIQWHDGLPLTVEDILYSFKKIQEPNPETLHLSNYYKDISKLEKLDKNTVRFTYAKPYFKALEFCGGLPIIPQHIYDDGQDFNTHSANRKPIGTGPFQFERWDAGKQIVLKRNEDYWDKSRFPQIKGIVFKVITDDAVALMALKKDLIDLMNVSPIQWMKQTNSPDFNARFVKHHYDAPVYYYVGWNLRRPQFNDKKVRQALTMLSNRQAIVDKLIYGLAKVISGPFFFQSDSYNKKVEPLPYDPEAAAKLLDEAGWTDHDGDGIRDKDGVKLEFQLLVRTGNRTHEYVASILKEDFTKAGIKMEIIPMERSILFHRAQTWDFDAVIMGWSSSFDDDPYQVWHSSQIENEQHQKGSNFVGYKNEEVDEILEKARSTFDKEKRSALYQRFHEIVAEDQPYTFLYANPTLLVRSARFKNVKIYKGGEDVLEWKLLE
ncbi:MAG: peptide-binding protein [Deltaproteobacteria bacterium]|nr:peptide-binding protein [Deltaproteobacteria bacterium]